MVLVAVNLKSNSTEQRVAISVPDGGTARIGRSPQAIAGEPAGLLAITWSDRLVSRSHCVATRKGDSLQLERLPALPGRGQPNVLYSNTTMPKREALDEPISLAYGDSVVIGAKGRTALYWLREEADLQPLIDQCQAEIRAEEEAHLQPVQVTKQAYDEVEQLDEYSLRVQLKLLQRQLPEQVLSGWTNRQELFARAAAFVETGLPGQQEVTAAFIAVDRGPSGQVRFERLSPDAADRANFQPSLRLLDQLNLEEPKPSDVHLWNSKDDQTLFSGGSLKDKGVDWVAAIPVAPLDDEGEVHLDRDHGRPAYLYVQNRQATENSAAIALPFLRLVTSLIASLLSARDQQRIQDRMSTYFSPGLRRLMRDSNEETLRPTMADCTIMFADRRGSSHLLETAKTDEQILDRLKENQEIVGQITEEVFNHDGVITDFAGDGALALWGWPSLSSDRNLHAIRAVEAAEAICRDLAARGEYEEAQGRFMAAVRLGISTGRIAVGKTGPAQQWHISVFGGVANLGARLERIAKEFKVPLLISDETYQRVKGATKERRFRKLCLINPAGFNESYPVYEVIQPKEWGGSGIDADSVKTYETALTQFIDRQWDACIDLLNTLPADDEPACWLRDRAEIFRIKPPSQHWQGEIASLSK